MFAEIIYISLIVYISFTLGSSRLHGVSLLFILLLFLPLFPILLALRSAPFVPSHKDKIDSMFRLAHIKPGQKVYDLGAGDGRITNKAAALGAESIGYELSLPLVLFFNLKRLLGFTKGKLLWRNIWKQDYSDANVIFIFLMPKAMKNFETKIFPLLKTGTYVVCNAFEIPNIKPTRVLNGVYLYIK